MRLLILLVILLAIPLALQSETLNERDLKSFNIYINLKASLLPVQNELREMTKDKDGKDVMVSKPELSIAYDKAATAFNKASESWKVLELAKKLGRGDGNARKTFEKDLTEALKISAQLHQGRGVTP